MNDHSYLVNRSDQSATLPQYAGCMELHPDGRSLRYMPDRATWRSWLADNHSSSKGIWLVCYKKDSGRPSVTYDEAVEEALCFGWIDSRVNSIDGERFMQVFTPRRVGSTWSAVNKERIDRLDAAGLIAEPGYAMIEAARADGSWSFLDDIDALIEPTDLAVALDADANVRSVWDTFPPSVKKQALFWVATAKRAETRRKRVQHIVDRAAEGRRPAD